MCWDILCKQPLSGWHAIAMQPSYRCVWRICVPIYSMFNHTVCLSKEQLCLLGIKSVCLERDRNGPPSPLRMHAPLTWWYQWESWIRLDPERFTVIFTLSGSGGSCASRWHHETPQPKLWVEQIITLFWLLESYFCKSSTSISWSNASYTSFQSQSPKTKLPKIKYFKNSAPFHRVLCFLYNLFWVEWLHIKRHCAKML